MVFPKVARVAKQSAWAAAMVVACSVPAALAADNIANIRIGGAGSDSGSVSSLSIFQSGERNVIQGVPGLNAAPAPATFGGGWGAIAITQQGADNGLFVDARVGGALAGSLSVAVVGDGNVQELAIGQVGLPPSAVTVGISILGSFNGSEEIISGAGVVTLNRMVMGDGNFFVSNASVTSGVAINDVIGGNTNTVIRDISAASAASLASAVTGDDNTLIATSFFVPGPAAAFGAVNVSQEVRGSRNVALVLLDGEVGARNVSQRILTGTIGAPEPFSSDDNTFIITAEAPGGTIDATIAGRNLEVLLLQGAGAAGQTLTVDARGSAGVGSPLVPGSGGQLTVIHNGAGPMTITQVAAPGSPLPGGTFVQP